MGDVVRTVPAVRALRGAYPDARLVWLVEPAAAGAVRLAGCVDDVLVFERARLARALRRGRLGEAVRTLRATARMLRSERFDLVVDFHSILRSALLARLSGAPVRLSYARPFGREGAPLLATHRARLAPRRMSRYERNAGLVAYLGTELGDVELAPVDGAARARAWRALGGEIPPIALHPGTSEATPYKRYPVERWAQVARELGEGGAPVLVTRGPAPSDVALAEAVVAASGAAARLAPETPELDDLAALFACCRLVLGSDSGPLHLAALVGTPVVQLLGPTHPVENAPHPRTPSRSVRAPQPCSPCRRGCDAATCMNAIEPHEVARAAGALLADAPGDAPRAAAAGA